MKISANEEVQFSTSAKKDKKTITISFKRMGKKDAKYTKELFWIKTYNEITNDVQTLKALRLDDLINIVSEAKKLIKKADLKNK